MDSLTTSGLINIALGPVSQDLVSSITIAILYGVSIPMLLLVINIYMKRGLSAQGTKITALASALCFVLFTTSFATAIANLALDFQDVQNMGVFGFSATLEIHNQKYALYDIIKSWCTGLMLCICNYLVVWRASILLVGRSWANGLLVTLCLADLGIKLAFHIRTSNIVTLISWSLDGNASLDRLNTTSYAFSLALHVIAISTIWYRLRKHARLLRSDTPRALRGGQRILTLLVETGLAFSVMQLIEFIFENGILNKPDASPEVLKTSMFLYSMFIFTTAVYPLTVTILVEGQKSLIHTVELMSAKEFGLENAGASDQDFADEGCNITR